MRALDRQPTLTGPTLRLRPLRAEDWDALYAVASDPQIWALHPAHDRWQEPVFRVFFAEALDIPGHRAMRDGIAVAAGPGLIGGVLIGLVTAKTLALVARKPLIAVNHLEAHALTARLTDGIGFPYLLLLASGGHTQLVAVRGVGDYVRLGSTIDELHRTGGKRALVTLCVGGGMGVATIIERV